MNKLRVLNFGINLQRLTLSILKITYISAFCKEEQIKVYEKGVYKIKPQALAR